MNLNRVIYYLVANHDVKPGAPFVDADNGQDFSSNRLKHGLRAFRPAFEEGGDFRRHSYKRYGVYTPLATKAQATHYLGHLTFLMRSKIAITPRD